MMLFTLCIVHEFGSDSFVFTTLEERQAELVKWADTFWDDDALGTPPEDTEVRVERYFDASQEMYWVGDVEVPGVMPVPSTEAARRCTDADALDEMAMLFSASEWPGSSGLEDLCSIVKRTGRKITDDPSIEWGRH